MSAVNVKPTTTPHMNHGCIGIPNIVACLRVCVYVCIMNTILNTHKGRGLFNSHTYPHSHSLRQSDVRVELNLRCTDVLEWACPDLWTRTHQFVAGIRHSGSLHMGNKHTHIKETGLAQVGEGAKEGEVA